MLDIAIVLVCAYFTFSNVRMLLEMPFASWAAEQYLLAVVSVLLVVVGVFKLSKVIRAFIGAQKLARQRAEALRQAGGKPPPDDSETRPGT